MLQSLVRDKEYKKLRNVKYGKEISKKVVSDAKSRVYDDLYNKLGKRRQ